MTKSVTPEDPVGDWNKRQVFDHGDVLLIGALDGGGYIIGRITEANPGEMVFVSKPFADADAVVAEAARLRKQGMH